MVAIKDHLTHFSFGQIFISAILAGWLMAQGGWLIMATPHSSGQILCIYVVTFIIGFGGLHHSIAGSAEIFTGLFHSVNPNYSGSFKFLTSAILGNLVGGTFFVAILNYGHIKKTQ
jgi:formate/nitrite transporter FocA (FNT family)